MGAARTAPVTGPAAHPIDHGHETITEEDPVRKRVAAAGPGRWHVTDRRYQETRMTTAQELTERVQADQVSLLRFSYCDLAGITRCKGGSCLATPGQAGQRRRPHPEPQQVL